MRLRFCPRCKSTQIIMVAGGQIGIWQCSRCGFQSVVFPERDFDDKELKKQEKVNKKKK